MHSEPCPFIPVQLVRGQSTNLCRTCGTTAQAHGFRIERPIPTPTRKELELCGAAIQSFEAHYMRYKTNEEILKELGREMVKALNEEPLPEYCSCQSGNITSDGWCDYCGCALQEPIRITEHGERVPPIAGDPPCEKYDPAGPGAGVEEDGHPQCANCGHQKTSHASIAKYMPNETKPVAPEAISMDPVESKIIDSLGYHPESQTLAVKFKHGGGGTYHYANFTGEDWKKLNAAPSIGSHFHNHIRDKFTFTKKG